MPKLRVQAFGVSLDGYGAGPDQSLENPMGKGGMGLHEWVFHSKFFRETHFSLFGKEGGETGVDDGFCARGFENVGAWILGRNMFGPVRGPWVGDEWKGWWGDNPTYHAPVFVLTHHARPPLEMEGGTTFHFVTDGAETALALAFEAAGGKDVRLGGGVATVREFLEKGLVDEMHLAVSPFLLGSGEALFAGLDLLKLGYRCVERVTGERTDHVLITKAE
ncbi:MAG: dihydrofolate reductase family protein [Acidobacteria bacterium]|nr:dihydrofolate reductase family protein [Acidobacteriota bacterium]